MSEEREEYEDEEVEELPRSRLIVAAGYRPLTPGEYEVNRRSLEAEEKREEEERVTREYEELQARRAGHYLGHEVPGMPNNGYQAEREEGIKQDYERLHKPEVEETLHGGTEEVSFEEEAEEVEELVADDAESGTLRKVGAASARRVGAALKDLDERFKPEQEEPRHHREHEERPMEREEAAGWLDADQGNLAAWAPEGAWGFAEWLGSKDGKESDSWV